jgi:ABC-type Fe3+ transport system substrate-binding protein
MKTLLAFALLGYAAGLCNAAAQTATAQQWDQLVGEAQKEGKIVLLGPPDGQVRQDLPAAFKARYGITVEYLGTRSAESATKLSAERSAGIYSVDVVLAGGETMSGVYYAQKMLAPLKPQLVAPDVVDPSKWWNGAQWYMDPEKTYVLRLFNTVLPSFHINTDLVKHAEVTSAHALLDPKWRGKISTNDPYLPGIGLFNASRYYLQFGEDFLRRLYVEQKPVTVRDRRQINDWLARGTYPIALDADDDEVKRMQQEGLPVAAVYALTDMQPILSTGIGQIAIIDHTPHPNAAKLFVNWIASQEGLSVLARSRGAVPTRTDIDASQWLAAEMIPKAGTDYRDMHDWTLGPQRQQARDIMVGLLKGR